MNEAAVSQSSDARSEPNRGTPDVLPPKTPGPMEGFESGVFELPGVNRPPRRGVPLGLRLGGSLALTVVVVLGVLTGIQWRHETLRERADREQLLVESLVPLAVRLEAADSVGQCGELLDDYRRIFIERGYRHHHLELRDAAGAVVASTIDPGTHMATNTLHGVEAIRSSLLAEGHGELHVWQDAASFDADIRQRRRDRWIKILVAAVTIIAAAQVLIFIFISRPLGRLLRRISKLELGYLGRAHGLGGAWEVRMLEWRLRRTAEELQATVQRLVAAERRALQHVTREAAAGGTPDGDEPLSDLPKSQLSRRDRLFKEYLEDLCRLMERAPAHHEPAASVAAETWDRWAVEAERLGEIGLKLRLEDAALRILDAESFTRLARRIEDLTSERQAWVDEQVRAIEQAVAGSGVQVLELHHRVKHVAGVWRKMQEKDLELEEISDLFAFRVIVEEESECYAALGALHRVFRPEPFRFKDYIERPKRNGYRSIHTSVRDPDGTVFEIQIRTRDMHRQAEVGAAAHWIYKAGVGTASPGSPSRLTRFFRRRTETLN